jgi:UDP-glucose 4-epimerase
MKVLVTGGAGFIGSHISDQLLAAGHDVAVVDDLSSGKRENLSDKARLHVLDIRSPELGKVFAEEKPEVVIHCAAQISVSRSVREPAFDATVNLVGPLNMLQHCVETGVRKIIFSSSGGTVYGEVPGEPAPENTVFAPMSPYGISKMAFEYYLEFFRQEFGLTYTALRYGNVYGPRQDPHGEAGVVAIFSKMMLSGKTPTINGDGKYYRDYVYAGDVARANVICLNKGDNRAFNVGTAITTDVNELYAVLKKVIEFPNEANHGPHRPGDLRRSVLAIDRAREELGWVPQMTLEEGFRNTVEYFRTHG